MSNLAYQPTIPEPKLTDKEVLNMLKKNPSEGIDWLLKEYGGAIRKICASILQGYSQEDIEEAISDTFFELWRATSRFQIDRDTSLKSYLYGIARRVSLNRKRRLAKDRLIPNELNEDIEDGRNVEQEVLDKMDAHIVHSLIDDMKSPEHEIFEKRYYEEMSVKEIAKALSLTPKSVENRLRRGKVALRRQLKRHGIEA